MKQTLLLLLVLILMLPGCSGVEADTGIVATTLPIYEFTTQLCHGTDIHTTLLIQEPVSCIHDYSLTVDQLRAMEAAQLILCNGMGLDSFVTDAIQGKKSVYYVLGEGQEHHHDHGHEHHHAEDPHGWLDPHIATQMCESIVGELTRLYPQYQNIFSQNLLLLTEKLEALDAYGKEQLKDLKCRELVTFHDGFSYLAEAYGLTILCAIEEEPGSICSPAQLTQLSHTVADKKLPAIFTEKNGSDASALIISRETNVKIYTLDMALSGDSYFDAMYKNIDTLKEALG